MNRASLKSFIHGSAASIIGAGLLGVMNYFIRRILALNLSETDYGFFYSALALVMILMVFLDLGLGQSAAILMSKSIARNDLQESKKIFTLAFITKVLFALIALAIMEFAAPYLARYYFKYPGSSGILMLIFLFVPVFVLESSFACVFAARKAFITQNIVINIKIFITLAGIFFCVKAFGIHACVLWFIAGSAVASVISFRLIRRYGITLLSVKTTSLDDLKNIFSLSSWIAVSTAGTFVMYYMDTICLTWLVDLKAVAMYNIALPIMQIAQSFFVFPVIFTPFVAEMWQRKDYTGIRRTCLIGSLLMLLTLPVFLLAGTYFASDIISILFDKKYIAAAPAVTILWCGMVFFSIASFNITTLNSGGKQKNAACMVLACAVVNLSLNIIMIPQFNYIGAALATAITYLIMAFVSIISLLLVFKEK